MPPVVGFDMLERTVQGLEAGHISASLWYPEYLFGALSGVVAHLFASLPANIVLPLLRAGTSQAEQDRLRLPAIMFTRDNVGSYVRWHQAVGDGMAAMARPPWEV